MNNILKIAGALLAYSLVTTVLIRFVLGADFLFSGLVMSLGFIVPIVIMILLGRKILRGGHSKLSYGEALKDLFIASLLSSVVGLAIATAVFQNDKEVEIAFSKYQDSAASLGADWGGKLGGLSEAEIEINKEKLSEDRKEGKGGIGQGYVYSWSMFPLNLINIVIFSLVFALITSIFVKEKVTST